jgi:hypothetical protein
MEVALGSTIYSSSSILASNDIGAALGTFVKGRNARLGEVLADLFIGDSLDRAVLWRARSKVLLPFKAKSKYTPFGTLELADCRLESSKLDTRK